MYSNHSFINVICSLEKKFKDFNDASLDENSLSKVPENDQAFIRKINGIKKNQFDSIIKDLLDNLDFFDFIYSKKQEFQDYNGDEARKLYEKLKEEYESRNQEKKKIKNLDKEKPFKNFLPSFINRGSK